MEIRWHIRLQPSQNHYIVESSDGKKLELLPPRRFLLLHSNRDDRLRLVVQEVKQTLKDIFSPCLVKITLDVFYKNTFPETVLLFEIEDFADQDQWEDVASNGVSWFLSRLIQNDTAIIVVEHEDALGLGAGENTNREREDTPLYSLVFQQLQALASSEYSRIFIVR